MTTHWSARIPSARILIAMLLLGVAFTFGLLVGLYKWAPYYQIRGIYKEWGPLREDTSPEKSMLLSETNAIVSLSSHEDIRSMRDSLRAFVWGRSGPRLNAMPRKVESGARPEGLLVSNASQVDRLTIEMEYGFNSIGYLFYPIAKTGKLMVYQQGHASDTTHDTRVISYFLKRGHHVLFLRMLLHDGNSQPNIRLRKFGNVKFQIHDQLKFLESAEFNPLKLFFEPVAIGINYASAVDRVDTIAMIGLSGGAWLTSVYAALDDRVTVTYPIAGTSPLFVRFALPHTHWGDYEQTHPSLYAVANQLEMYVLGSHGKGRKQVLIFNKYDPCCYAGTSYQSYESAVRAKVQQLGDGQFSVWLDKSHYEHKISDAALAFIATELGNH